MSAHEVAKSAGSARRETRVSVYGDEGFQYVSGMFPGNRAIGFSYLEPLPGGCATVSTPRPPLSDEHIEGASDSKQGEVQGTASVRDGVVLATGWHVRYCDGCVGEAGAGFGLEHLQA